MGTSCQLIAAPTCMGPVLSFYKHPSHTTVNKLACWVPVKTLLTPQLSPHFGNCYHYCVGLLKCALGCIVRMKDQCLLV